MQVFAQKSVLVVSIYFPLIALICTDIPYFRVNPCLSVVDIASLPLRNTKKKAVSVMTAPDWYCFATAS